MKKEMTFGNDKYKVKVGGLKKRIREDKWDGDDKCLSCNSILNSLHSIEELEVGSDPDSWTEESMEWSISECPQCKKLYLYTEAGDYDYFVFREVERIVEENENKKEKGTEEIKSLIPTWLTDEEIERLRNEFIPAIPKEKFEQIVKNEKSWKRDSKRSIEGGFERVFDCRPLDSQLRLYVITDRENNITSHYFQSE